MWKRFRSLFRVLTSQRDFEEGITEELRFHIEQYTGDLVRSGVSPEEAARRARIEFGNLTNVKGDCREARSLHLFDELVRELRYAARLLRKTPGFAVTALLTFAVCLGANLTIFAVIDSVLLRPLPFPDAGRLVTVFNTYPKAGVERDGSSLTNYYERRGHIPAFTSLAIYRYGTAIIGEAGSTEREQITRVSSDFFTTLGLGPAIGRTFIEEETTFRTGGVAILTDAYWRQRYNADPHVIGRQIRVDGLPQTVIGVLPPSFRFLSSEARLYFPLASRAEDRRPLQRHSGGNVTQMIARLKPGATLTQAQSQIDTQNATLEADDPPGQNDCRCGLSFYSGATACRPRRSDPSHSTVAASRHTRPSLNRRSQSREPASHPCQWSSQGIGCPAGTGREPKARGERSDSRDHVARGVWRVTRARGRGLGNPPQRQPGVLAAGVVTNVPLSGKSGKSAAR